MSYTTADIEPELLRKLKGPIPPLDFKSNGCSCAPDFWPPIRFWDMEPVDLRPACHFHDFVFDQGGGKREFRRGNLDFYKNLLICGMTPRCAAGVYYRRVALIGMQYFNWKRDKPNSVKRWLGAAVGRYLMPLPR